MISAKTLDARPRAMKILSFTSLYPSVARPAHGIFVENRLRHLHASGKVELRVVAPVPLFPFRSERFGSYSAYARTPATEIRHNIRVTHPRYPLIPKFGMTSAPLFLYLATRGHLRKLISSGFDFDLIDAHYFYPDGVAAALLAREFNKRLTITARGTDINLIPEYRLARAQINWAAERADALITVCQALKDRLVELDVESDKVTVLRNGVDLNMFRPIDRDEARRSLGLTRQTVLSVGHLVERKGHHLVIEAIAALPEVDLMIAGEGPEEKALKALAQRLGLDDRVQFLGRVPHEDLQKVYGAADALVLASSREGWPNVLLETMACGTPAIATPVWGSGEVIQKPEAGRLAEARSVDALMSSIRDLLANLPDRSATRRYAEGFSWDDTTNGQLSLFKTVLS